MGYRGDLFGPKRDEVTWEWRKLHNEELIDLYFSPNIVQVIILEDPYINRIIMLQWIFKKWDVGLWTGSVWLRIGTGCGHL